MNGRYMRCLSVIFLRRRFRCPGPLSFLLPAPTMRLEMPRLAANMFGLQINVDDKMEQLEHMYWSSSFRCVAMMCSESYEYLAFNPVCRLLDCVMSEQTPSSFTAALRYESSLTTPRRPSSPDGIHSCNETKRTTDMRDFRDESSGVDDCSCCDALKISSGGSARHSDVLCHIDDVL